MEYKCRLCGSETTSFYSLDFVRCKNCKGIQRILLPNYQEEKSRYDLHQNDIHDAGYQNFVSPIINYVVNNFNINDTGLDFGSGPSSVISSILQSKNFDIKSFDPFYSNHQNVLQNQYDFIICCEVIEHFHNPQKEFKKLKSLLKNNGKLIMMTHLYDDSMKFESWYYKNDFTHVFFYTKETLEWIKNEYPYAFLSIKDRLIILSA